MVTTRSSTSTTPVATTESIDERGDAAAANRNRNGNKDAAPNRPRRRRYNIAMVCDFFYPRTGGVENHIYSLSQHLIRQGHKVIVVTHSYSRTSKDGSNGRAGVRYLPGPLKVYHCPFIPMTDQDILPTLTATFPLWRQIMVREQIEIVHTHQATSVMANESLVYASAMGIPSVFTDHSLFQLDDVAGVVLNRVLQTTLSQVSAVICVSHACRDNLVLRAQLLKNKKQRCDDDDEKTNTKREPIIAVIPNAVDSSKFTPVDDDDDDDDVTSNKKKEEKDVGAKRIKVVVVSRLVYRKGVDLLVGIIPKICQRMPSVDFIVGGDGNKLLALQEMVEYQHLQDRVTFLGSVPHVNVASVLRQGSIFLNCSLTESFCIAILEAASCGLLVVSTNVGGVPEVLPEDDMIILCDASVDALVDGLRKAIERQQQESTLVRGHLKQQSLLPPVDAVDAHERITQMYSWHRVAVQTIHEIYDKIVVEDDADDDDAKDKNPSLVVRGGRRIYLPKESFPQRLMKYNDALGGGLSGFVVCVLALYVELWIRCVEILQPIDGIDVVPDLIPPLSPSQPAASMSGA